MRKGVNTSKIKPDIKLSSYHRIIIPVYIPSLSEEYYKDGLEILQYCLTSLFRTIHNKTRVSIINNGCCQEVVELIKDFKRRYKTFDQFYDSDNNLGKINAVYSAVRANIEPLITVSDADVLFLEGWQESVETVFTHFPKAGMVSPVPSSIAFENPNSSVTLGYAILKSKFLFSEIQDNSGLLKFQDSIGRSMYREAHLKQWPVIRNNDVEAVIGCGHFCATIKRKSLEGVSQLPTRYKLGMGTDAQYIDKPINKAGYLKLATTQNLAYHLGNIVENWMNDALPNANYNATPVPQNNLHLEVSGISKRVEVFGNITLKLFKRYKFIKIWYLKRRGLKYKYY